MKDNMKEMKKGLSDEELRKVSGGETGLKVIDNALQRAANPQANVGSTGNRLKFTSEKLTTSSDNLKSAESSYKDADMSKEMPGQIKNNILLQARTAMLSKDQ